MTKKKEKDHSDPESDVEDDDYPITKTKEDDAHPENKKRAYEPGFKGPIQNRHCTDIFCLVLFIIFLLGEGVVAYFAFSLGNPEILIKPTDSQGRVCGAESMQGKPYLFFFDLIQCARAGPAVAILGCPTPQVCVSQCPQSDWTYFTLAAKEKADGVPDLKARAEQLICKDSVNKLDPNRSIMDYISKEDCAAYYLKSEQVFSRCVPWFIAKGVTLLEKLGDEFGNSLKDQNGRNISAADIRNGNTAMFVFLQAANVAEKVLGDLRASWYWILLIILMSAVLALAYCLLLKFFAFFMVVFTLLAFFFTFIGSASYCLYRYSLATNTNSGKVVIYSNPAEILNLKEFWLGLTIVGYGLALIVFIIVIFLRNRIRLAIAILGEASKAIGAIMSSLFYPLAPFVLELGVIAWWLCITIYLAATGKQYFHQVLMPSTNQIYNSVQTIQQNSKLPPNASIVACGTNVLDPMFLGCTFTFYGGNQWSYALHVYNLFMAFWLFAFLTGMCEIVLAGAFASWYWAWHKPKDVPAFPIASSLLRTIRYHLGTVAFGSLILAIIMTIRAMLMYLERKFKKKKNCFAKFCMCLCNCCFWCLEKVMRFLTKNAYIVTAVLGKSFCPAAANAFFLVLRNCLRLLVVDNVTGFVLFMGKILITGLVGTFTYFFFTNQLPGQSTTINHVFAYFYVPLVVVIVGTFAICCLFFSVYDFAVDTLFICVMEDLERHDGSEEKPYYMSKSLLKALKVKNKFKHDDRDGCCACCTLCCC